MIGVIGVMVAATSSSFHVDRVDSKRGQHQPDRVLGGHCAIGQVFAVFVIAVAAAGGPVGLGIILAFYRNKETISIDEMNLMRW
jgi:hypothetical protein